MELADGKGVIVERFGDLFCRRGIGTIATDRGADVGHDHAGTLGGESQGDGSRAMTAYLI